MAYDATRREVVLFGGYTTQGDSNDTWIWNGMDWIQRFPATSPPPSIHAMAYDAARGETVLFGGSFTDIGTWIWDGVNWTQRFPPVSPSIRWAYSMAYDSGRARVVLFGGTVPPGCPTCHTDETWTWDGTTWNLEQPAVRPPALSGFAMAHDEARGETVQFGGSFPGGSSLSAGTWAWDGTNWTLKTPATSPPPLGSEGLAADSIRSQLILFGGANGHVYPVDTWAWDGNNWTLLPLSIHPPAGAGGMAYDSARGQIVLFGGGNEVTRFMDGTWIWGDDNPVCSNARATPGELWPPNHQLIEVRIAGVTDPQNESVNISINEVTQDEPVEGLGDGDTAPDAFVRGEKVSLRSERSGTGNGRVYRISFTATNGRGGSCSGTASVSVPLNKKPGTHATDDGQLYNSTRP
ncbi:MAG: hypothetical protein HYR58_00880 [Acidobacteria bacterium]|nr:hypothetical protein [Acidobacteriota bacterium]